MNDASRPKGYVEGSHMKLNQTVSLKSEIHANNISHLELANASGGARQMKPFDANMLLNHGS